MSDITDFTENEMWTIGTTLKERYGEPVPPELADSELRLDPLSPELTLCPTAFWKHNGCHLLVCKTGETRYRCQFYYGGHEMYGTGVEEFDDLAECMVTLLQVQAEHEASKQA